MGGNDTPLVKREFPLLTRLMIYFYFFIAFYEPYLNGILGSVTKYYIFALMAVVMFTAKKINPQVYHINYVVWLLYLFITLLWASDLTIFKINVLSQIGMVALFCVLTMVQFKGMTIDNIIKTIWAGSASIGFLSLFFSKPYNAEAKERLVLTLWGQHNDPNNQAAFVAMGVAISLYFLLIEKKYKIPSILIIAINIYSMLLTGSRGGLISLIVILGCFIILKTEKKSFSKRLKNAILIIAIAVVLYYIVQRYLPQFTFERLFNFESYEDGSKRTVIWKNTIELIFTNLNFIFGAGWGSYYPYKGSFAAVHNTYLAMFSDVGLIGFIIFFKPVVSATRYMIKEKDILPICLLLSGLIPSFFLDAINKRFFWNVIILLFIVYNYYKDNSLGRSVKYD